MAAAETARLVASLTLDDKNFSKGLTSAQRKLGAMESTAFRVGQNIGQGTQNAINNIAKIGVVAAGALTVAVAKGLSDLAELENAVTSVDGAISQLGLTGQLTGKEVAQWANDIERDIDAAFDDKAITQAATTLLRFGKVTPKNLRPALEVVADLAAKTGDVESASELLAKALADPAKAAGRLTRIGIILTDQQKEQIKVMTEAGDVAGAQALLLDAVAQSTAGAAKAMAGPYQDAINKTNDAIEDGRKALAIGFLPVITKVADKLSTLVADPKALASIQAFGETLAGGLDDLISLAERLPWQSIGTSLQIAGVGAKAVLTAFTSLPPWVQTAVLTGWGLNKLTGGALSGIVSELGKGLIKGVLGINAGVVQIRAGTVTGAAGGAAAAGGRGGGVAAAAAKVFIVGAAAAFFAELLSQRLGQAAANQAQAAGVANQATVFVAGANIEDLRKNLAGLRERQAYLTNNLTPEAIAYQLDIDGVKTTTEQVIGQLEARIASIAGDDAVRQNAANERLEAIKAQNAADAAAVAAKITTTNTEIASTRAAEAQHAAALSGKIATTNSELQTSRIAAATNAASVKATTAAGLADVRGAVDRKDLSVAVSTTNIINNTISARETIKTQTTYKNYQRFQS